MKPLTFVAIFTLFLCSCTDSSRAKISRYDNNYKIEVISGGQIVRTYTSSGKVQSQKRAGSYYFLDSATGNLVEISGEVIITQLD